MAKLLLVRHGNTRLNSTERYWGQTDVELGDDGIRQAGLLRDRLASHTISAVYASDLKRAVVTAEVIVAKRGLDIVACPELRETNFGDIEGLTFQEITERHPDLAMAWKNWSLTLKFPGGESVEELDSRVRQFLAKLDKHTTDETLLIVAHSASLRLLLCHLLGLELKHWRQFRIDLASLSIVDTYPSGGILSLLNDVSHLKKGNS